MCVSFTSNVDFIIRWLCIFQSETNSTQDCDVKCVIAVQHLIEWLALRPTSLLTAQNLSFFFLEWSVKTLTFHDVVCFSFWAVDDQGSASSTLTVVIVKCYGCSNHGVCDFDHPRPTSEPNQLRTPCLCDIGWEGTTTSWLLKHHNHDRTLIKEGGTELIHKSFDLYKVCFE